MVKKTATVLFVVLAMVVLLALDFLRSLRLLKLGCMRFSRESLEA